MRASILVRLFSDIDGETFELFGYIAGMERAEFSARFPSVKGKKFDGKRYQVAKDSTGRILPVTRAIEFKKTAKVKRCDSRCLYALGPNCECQCGGVNHGRGDAGASLDLFTAEPGPARAGFFEDKDARVEEAAADFALEFMGGALDLGAEQLEISGFIGGSSPTPARDPRQNKLF